MTKVLITFLAIILSTLSLLWFAQSRSEKQKSTSPSPTQSQTQTQTATTQPSSKPDSILFTVVAKNLEVPWALAFLPDPDGRLLVTERPGRVRIVANDGNVSLPILTLKVAQKIQGEGGLHGVAIHPEFTKNKYLYFYYTYEESDQGTLNRVSRFTFESDRLTDETTIVDAIPGALFHDGGRIKFGSDGYLYITTGDAQNPSLAQDRSALAGKILRVTDTGKPAPGNPFNTRIYSYGHRNPQGITWDDKGNLWETEHGQTTTDELNRIEKGSNYGWPTITGDQSKESMVSPILHSSDDTWAPGGVTYYEGSIFFAGLRGQALFEAVLNDTRTKVVTLKIHFKNQFGRIREVVLGPDNMLYITTSNKDGRGSPKQEDDKILKVNPELLD